MSTSTAASRGGSPAGRRAQGGTSPGSTMATGSSAWGPAGSGSGSVMRRRRASSKRMALSPPAPAGGKRAPAAAAGRGGPRAGGAGGGGGPPAPAGGEAPEASQRGWIEEAHDGSPGRRVSGVRQARPRLQLDEEVAQAQPGEGLGLRRAPG